MLFSIGLMVACAGGSAQQVDSVAHDSASAGPAAPASLEAPAGSGPAEDGISEDGISEDGISSEDQRRARVRVELDTYVDADLRAIISEEARQFRTCYARALGRNPDVNGSMTVHLSLEGGRPADDSPVAVDATGDWRFVECIEEALSLWAVPGGHDGDVAFTLQFSRRA